MGSYRAHLRGLDRVRHLAWEEARRLSFPAIGPDEYLLALLHSGLRDSLAGRALNDCSITAERLVEELRSRKPPEPFEGGPQLASGEDQLEGLAEGLAAGLGAASVESEHVLLARLWEPDFSRVFVRLGSSREQVRARLRELGVALPAAELPADGPRCWGAEVEVPVEELSILLAELPYVMPKEASLSFNHDGKKRGWLAATEGIGLREYIPLGLARHQELEAPD